MASQPEKDARFRAEIFQQAVTLMARELRESGWQSHYNYSALAPLFKSLLAWITNPGLPEVRNTNLLVEAHFRHAVQNILEGSPTEAMKRAAWLTQLKPELTKEQWYERAHFYATTVVPALVQYAGGPAILRFLPFL